MDRKGLYRGDTKGDAFFLQTELRISTPEKTV